MCLDPETRVPLADGRDHRLGDLIGASPVIGYACTASGRVRFVEATVHAGGCERCASVKLDSDELILVGDRAEVMRRDGLYAFVDQLRPQASLMPLYRKRDKEGYVLVQQNYSGRWQKAHWIVARCGLLGPIPRFEGQRTVIHHKNFDEADNSPPNLGFMGANDHAAFHRSIVERNEHWQSTDFEARRVAALGRKARTVEGHAYFAERGTKNIVAYMKERPDHFKNAVAGNGRRGAPKLRSYNTSEKGRAKSKELANTLHECERCGAMVKSYIGLHNHRKHKHGYNHKVEELTRSTKLQELVCITVSDVGNFAVSAGIFVRACAQRE